MAIAPSILSADFSNLQRDITNLEKSGADLIHVDIMDGHFVPNMSFGLGLVKSIRPFTKIPLDIHLMAENPENFIDEICDEGADIVTVHYESTAHIYRALQMIKNKGKKAGVVINPGTPVSVLWEVLPIVDQVLIMTVNPGFGGQKFIPQMAQKVAELDELRKENDDFAYNIEVDGGINDQTIAITKDAGADIFVAGSYVFNGDMADRISNLKELSDE